MFLLLTMNIFHTFSSVSIVDFEYVMLAGTVIEVRVCHCIVFVFIFSVLWFSSLGGLRKITKV